ncbi:hypothetical protein [Azospirillum sp. A26]|uniref:oxidoreductase n=1 Tax=Azospirillum sp. A26 TaxID=3160607 RepID=UPI00366E0EAF
MTVPRARRCRAIPPATGLHAGLVDPPAGRGRCHRQRSRIPSLAHGTGARLPLLGVSTSARPVWRRCWRGHESRPARSSRRSLSHPFARAAGDAKRLGFDTIELHGAHGYLFDQFFWAATNRRTDRYGGVTIGERSRFAAEVVAAVLAELV